MDRQKVRDSLAAIANKATELQQLREKVAKLKNDAWLVYDSINVMERQLIDLQLMCEGALLALRYFDDHLKGASNG
jgi:hypothetical protein